MLQKLPTSSDQPIYQPTHPSTNKRINQPVYQPTILSLHVSFDNGTCHHLRLPHFPSLMLPLQWAGVVPKKHILINQPVYHSTNQPPNISTNQLSFLFMSPSTMALAITSNYLTSHHSCYHCEGPVLYPKNIYSTINQSTIQQTNQQTFLPTNQLTNLSTNRPFYQAKNNQPFYQPTNQQPNHYQPNQETSRLAYVQADMSIYKCTKTP